MRTIEDIIKGIKNFKDPNLKKTLKYTTRWNDDDREKMFEMRGQGRSLTEIAHFFKTTDNIIWVVLTGFEERLAERYWENWMPEEYRELVSEDFDVGKFVKKYKRGKFQSSLRRRLLLRQMSVSSQRSKAIWSSEDIIKLEQSIDLPLMKLQELFPDKKLKNIGTKRSKILTKRAMENNEPFKRQFTTCKPWSDSSIKKLIHLKKQKIQLNEIVRVLGKTSYLVHSKWLEILSAQAERYDEPWTEPENLELIKPKINYTRFCEKFKRDSVQSINQRNFLLTGKLIKCPNRKISYQIQKALCPEKTYDDTPKKHYVQETIYKKTDFTSHARVLLGPTPERFLDLLNKYILGPEDFIYSNEIEFKYLVQQKEVFDEMKFNRVNLTYGDITAAPVQKFIDVDLMCKWETGKPILKSLLDRQKKTFRDKKIFNYSVSTMRDTNESIPVLIKTMVDELLGIDSLIDDGKEIPFQANDRTYTVKHYETLVDSDEYVVHAYAYNDTSPMLSLSIHYK